MNGGKILDQIRIDLRNTRTPDTLQIYIDVYDNSLSRKWLTALNELLAGDYHLEKNYCWLGWVESPRNAKFICDQINQSILAINRAGIGYTINDFFSVDNTIDSELRLRQDRMNDLHRYFEDLQGISGRISNYYNQASLPIRWHIRQLNLLCHEYESLVLSMRKAVQAPQWRRPSQLMCWLNAPRFKLDSQDYELFGIDTINRPLGGVFVGVNKAVGKHHWEVFMDEGRRGARVSELTTSTLRSQTEAAGDFDIEWANNPGDFPWQKKLLAEFRQWLLDNEFDPDDKSLTIGHPLVAQVDLTRSFGTTDYQLIWSQLTQYLDVHSISTGQCSRTYLYNWSDPDYAQLQMSILGQHR